MEKFSFQSQMSSDIPEHNKEKAKNSLLLFDQAEKALQNSKKYLDLFKSSFENDENQNVDKVFEHRSYFREFRDNALDRFNFFKRKAYEAIQAINVFAYEPNTLKLMKSLISEIDLLEFNVNKFADLFSNIQDKDFITNVNKSITAVEKQCDIVSNILTDRIPDHINKNILTKSWIDNFDDSQSALKPQDSLFVQINKEFG